MFFPVDRGCDRGPQRDPKKIVGAAESAAGSLGFSVYFLFQVVDYPGNRC